MHSIVLEVPLKVANGGTAPVDGHLEGGADGGYLGIGEPAQGAPHAQGQARTITSAPGSRSRASACRSVNEAIIGLQDKDYWNHLTPKNDLTTFGAYILNPIAVRDAAAISFYKTGGPLAGCATAGGSGPQTNRTDIVNAINIGITGAPAPLDHVGGEAIGTIGDVLRLDLGQPSGFPNGRKLTDDVVDVELQLLLCTLAAGTPIPDGPTQNEAAFKAGFPTWRRAEGRTAVPRPANTPAP